jgi:hypothetical protein
MPVARVVTFEGISTDRIEEMKREMQDGDPPEGLNATEVVVLHDADADRAVAIVYFETEDDYRRGDEVLNAMPAADVPGRRLSVEKYDVAIRMTS